MSPLTGSSWTKKTARSSFPILVERALARYPITYGDWDNLLVKRRIGHHVHLAQYGHPAGAIGDACRAYEEKYGVRVPPINLLVVNKKSRVPGKGASSYANSYMLDYLKNPRRWQNLSLLEKRAVIDQAHEEISQFKNWNIVLREFGLRANKIVRAKLPKKKSSSYRKTWARGGEGQDHKRLKEYIRQNPQLIGLSKRSVGTIEYMLPSGDEIDVYFGKERLAVEVKARRAPVGELHRGLFQCVKYRALVRATLKSDGMIPEGKSLLVIEDRLTSDLRKVASIIDVRVRENVRVPSTFRHRPVAGGGRRFGQ